MEQLMEQIQSGLCRFIGELLLEARLVTPSQLKEAIQIQQDSGELLGQILVRQGTVTQQALVELLELQLAQRLKQPDISHRQLGEILLSLHAVSRWQLSRALEIQSEIPKKIGQLLVELGYTTRGNIEQALSHQVVGKCDTGCCHQRRSLGELLLQANRVTPDQLEQALMVQRGTQAYLGDILVAQGVLNEAELEDLLAAQLLLACSQGSPDAEMQPVYKRLGEILVETHQLTPLQLNEAIADQERQQGRKLGDILVEKGLVPLKELLRALRLQERLATLSMATLTGVTLLASCGTPQVPTQQPLSFIISQQQQMQQFNPLLAHSVRQGPFKVLQVDSGVKIQVYQNGSRLIDNVPFFRQGNDNTCGQAVMTSLLNFWGITMEYQGVVNEANPRNLPTTDQAISNYLRQKGLQAQPYRGATLDNLIAQINKGRPSVVLLDFGGLSQEHYVIVVGYNSEKQTMIVHDSLEGPYVEMPMTRFVTMWDNKALRSIHLFGGENYKRLLVDVYK
ncbi:MAG: C39 family peptidase [Candidatus Sericytochromatia bacterium]